MKKYATTVIAVFCYILDGDRILLIRRSRAPSQNEYTVVGGKKELHEDPISACKREVREETGLTVENLRLRGMATSFLEGCDYDVISLYYCTRDFTGDLRESGEGSLQWISLTESYTMEGVSPYYQKVTPHVVGGGGVFHGIFRTDKNGTLREAVIR